MDARRLLAKLRLPLRRGPLAFPLGPPRRWRIVVLALTLAGLTLAGRGRAEVLVFTAGEVVETAGPWVEAGRAIVFTTPSGGLRTVAAAEVDLVVSRFVSAELATPTQPIPSHEHPPVERADLVVSKPSCGFTWRVVKVVDGATLEVEASGSRQTVRVACLDVPGAGRRVGAGRGRFAEYGIAASEFARQLLDDKQVCLRADAVQQPRDGLGRLVAEVTLADGTDVGAASLAHGVTQLAPGACGHREHYAGLVAAARAAGRGSWGAARWSGDLFPPPASAPIFLGEAGEGADSAIADKAGSGP